MERSVSQSVTDERVVQSWNPIIVVGTSAEGSAPVSVEPQPDGTAVLRVGLSAVLCRNVRQALCAATGWVLGRIAIVTGPMDQE
jgi:hypothetical protein